MAQGCPGSQGEEQGPVPAPVPLWGWVLSSTMWRAVQLHLIPTFSRVVCLYACVCRREGAQLLIYLVSWGTDGSSGEVVWEEEGSVNNKDPEPTGKMKSQREMQEPCKIIDYLRPFDFIHFHLSTTKHIYRF